MSIKLLLFSDLHCNVEAAERLVLLARDADIVVGAGDFGSGRHGIEIAINVLKAVECPAVLVPGNNEFLEELQEACQIWPQARVLHGSGETILGVPFYGLGGGVPVTPYGDWSYDFTEEQAAGLLQGCPMGAVLISHSPPFGAVDLSSQGRNLGSVAVRDTVLRVGARLVVCGHIHASAGKQALLGTSPVVNAGPDGILWELS